MGDVHRILDSLYGSAGHSLAEYFALQEFDDDRGCTVVRPRS
jgi:hypothetical protein